MDIKEIAKIMAREEFLEESHKTKMGKLKTDYDCPSCYGLEVMNTDFCLMLSYPKCKECWTNAVKGIKFKVDIEGEKMEGKAIKVKCIDKSRGQEITIGKEYKLLSESERLYFIENDLEEPIGYFKEKFEKVEDVLMVECIDNTYLNNELTLNKQYKVIREAGLSFYIVNDNGIENDYWKTNFKLVEQQKEVKEEKKEYGLTETLFLKDGEKYTSEHKTIRREGELIIIESLVNENKIVLSLKDKFTKVEEQKPVSFMEAIANDSNRIRVELDNVMFGTPVVKEFNKYVSVTEMFKNLGIKLSHIGINRAVKDGKWYIEN